MYAHSKTSSCIPEGYTILYVKNSSVKLLKDTFFPMDEFIYCPLGLPRPCPPSACPLFSSPVVWTLGDPWGPLHPGCLQPLQPTLIWSYPHPVPSPRPFVSGTQNSKFLESWDCWLHHWFLMNVSLVLFMKIGNPFFECIFIKFGFFRCH